MQEIIAAWFYDADGFNNLQTIFGKLGINTPVQKPTN